MQLVEIPTDDETHDNIVAYWRPDTAGQSGDTLSFDYRLYWQDAEPNYPTDLAKVVATRIGRGGIPGSRHLARQCAQIRHRFAGRRARQRWQPRYDITPVVTCLQRQGRRRLCHQGGGHQSLARACSTCTLDGKAPIDLRCFLQAGRQDAHRDLDLSVFPLIPSAVGMLCGDVGDRERILVDAGGIRSPVCQEKNSRMV